MGGPFHQLDVDLAPSCSGTLIPRAGGIIATQTMPFPNEPSQPPGGVHGPQVAPPSSAARTNMTAGGTEIDPMRISGASMSADGASNWKLLAHFFFFLRNRDLRPRCPERRDGAAIVHRLSQTWRLRGICLAGKGREERCLESAGIPRGDYSCSIGDIILGARRNLYPQ